MHATSEHRVQRRDLWPPVWQHALLSFYLRLPRPGLPPVLARRSVALMWGVWLVGTALAVLAYPQAVDFSCVRNGLGSYCQYPLHDSFNPLYRFNQGLGVVLLVSLLGGPPLLLVITLIRTFWLGLRGHPRRGGSAFTLAQGWDNGLIALLRLTPLAPVTIIHIRILSRLHSARRHWAWFALSFGAAAAVGVSQGVVHPPFWWLGGWANWMIQLWLVVLWALALMVWVVVACVFLVLNEVTHSTRGSFGLSWSTFSLLAFLVSVFVPLGMVWRMWLRDGFRHQYAPAEWWVMLPLILAGVGVLVAALHYALAQGVFWLRLKTTARRG